MIQSKFKLQQLILSLPHISSLVPVLVLVLVSVTTALVRSLVVRPGEETDSAGGETSVSLKASTLPGADQSALLSLWLIVGIICKCSAWFYGLDVKHTHTRRTHAHTQRDAQMALCPVFTGVKRDTISKKDIIFLHFCKMLGENPV